MNDPHPDDPFFAHPECRQILRCIQCGACSGSCPLGAETAHEPRSLFALIGEGDATESLESNQPWSCVSMCRCRIRFF